MVLEETKVDPKCLEFEITETSIIQNEEKSLAMITLLKDMGITISLDDFGTGYSSISYLKKFKVDYLKIDRSFINGLLTCSDDQAIVRSILNLAHDLNMKVVAEGVETEEQLEFLLKHHCDVIQGYLFSKPVEIEDFNSLLALDQILIEHERIQKKSPVRRESLRIDIPAPIDAKMTVTEIDGVSILLGDTQVQIENIGIGGLRFSTTLPLPILKKLKLVIETDTFQKHISVEGRILWKDNIEDKRYQYGVEFELTEKERVWLTSELQGLKRN
jgi:hypothetical protein